MMFRIYQVCLKYKTNRFCRKFVLLYEYFDEINEDCNQD